MRTALYAMEAPVKNSDNSDRTLADVEKTFYEAMSKNTVFSSVNKSASALEKLAVNTEASEIPPRLKTVNSYENRHLLSFKAYPSI
jgi:hypothetical protein